MYPKSQRASLFNPRRIFQNLLLLGVIIASVIFAFLSDSVLLKILASIAIAIVGTMMITDYIFNYFVSNYNLAGIINELLYLFLGIPIGVIAATYLPISIYIAFFRPKNIYIVVTVFVLVGFLQIASIAYLLKQHIRDKGMYSMGQYLKYLFDFKRRREEAEKLEKRTREIDDFYSRFENVENRIERMRQEKATDLKAYNWKEKVDNLEHETELEGTVCPKCGTFNELGIEYCSNCGHKLK